MSVSSDECAGARRLRSSGSLRRWSRAAGPCEHVQLQIFLTVSFRIDDIPFQEQRDLRLRRPQHARQLAELMRMLAEQMQLAGDAAGPQGVKQGDRIGRCHHRIVGAAQQEGRGLRRCCRLRSSEDDGAPGSEACISVGIVGVKTAARIILNTFDDWESLSARARCLSPVKVSETECAARLLSAVVPL